MPPKGADFTFTIDFVRGEGNPRRVFDSASHLIQGFELLDAAVATSVDKSFDPLLVLEDVESGSLKVILRNILNSIDDEALKKSDWKQIIGSMLLKAKYIVLEFCDNATDPDMTRMETLKNALRDLAKQTDIRHLPDYPPINEAKLISAVENIQNAKRDLIAGDKLTIESDGRRYEVDLTSTQSPARIEATPAIRIRASESEMILVVRKPDLLKDSMWSFIYQGGSVSAPILDNDWLQLFHSRKIPLFPGDALRCSVGHTYQFDLSDKLIADKVEILKVLETIAGQAPQSSFL